MKKVISFVLVLTFIFTIVFSFNSYAYTNFSGAYNASIGTTYNGTITNSQNEYCYRFSLNTSGRVIIKSSAYLKCEYILYDSNYEELYSENMRWAESTSGIYNYKETFDLVSGTYYFAVKQYEGTGNYNLLLTYTSANESFKESVNSVLTSINTANSISVGQKYRGQIAYNDSVDYYKFNLSSSGLLNMKSLAESKCNYYLYDAEYNEVFSCETRWFDYTGDYINVNENIHLKKGTYYLGVFQYEDTGAYDILLKFSSANETFAEDLYTNNDSVKTSNSVSINTLYKGHLAINDDTDYYKFTLGKKTELNIKSTASFKCNYALYNSEMDEIFDESTRWYDFSADVIKFSKQVTLMAGTYYLRIVPYDGLGNYNFTLSVIVNVSKPTGLKCTGRSTSAQKVAWNKVSGVTGYQVQISNNGGSAWAKYYSTSSNSYTFKGLTAGGKYKFRVRAYKDVDGQRYYGSWSSTLTSPTLPGGTSLTKLKAGKKVFTAQWKKQANTTGYQIQYSTNAKFGKAKTVTFKDVKTLKNTFKKLSAKKVYYVRIRTYKSISKVNYFSAWSKTYKVKTK